MSPWINEHGELSDDCPQCEATRRDCEIQIGGLERDLRGWRSKATRAENKLEAAEVGKRDGKLWKETVAYWQQKFPNQRITSKGVKSSRATKYFLRLDAGAMPEDFLLAIDGAHSLPYVVYGARRASGSKADLRIDLEHI